MISGVLVAQGVLCVCDACEAVIQNKRKELVIACLWLCVLSQLMGKFSLCGEGGGETLI